MSRFLISLFLFAAILQLNSSVEASRSPGKRPTTGQPVGSGPLVEVLDREGRPVVAITDGDQIRLRLRLPSRTLIPMQVTFRLDSGRAEDEGFAVGKCMVVPGGDVCLSPAFRAWGWSWDPEGVARTHRQVSAWTQAWGAGKPMQAGVKAVQVASRPVVLVHGFSSSYEAWSQYTGQDGYLARQRLAGYAVGDGQVEGVLNTGSLTDPTLETNTIAENAAILSEYITQVKAVTGAQSVDLVAHSMGGLISRYYIGRVMGERDVAQLIMLGSPMAGSDCTNLPAALGFYLPAVLEIRTSYVQGIFNEQVIDRKGVPFFALAGVAIQNPIGTPCAPAPSDMVIARQSVAAIPLHLDEVPLLHTDLNTSPEVFNDYVLPRLQAPASDFPDEVELPAVGPALEEMQFTPLVAGHVDPGQPDRVTVQIDPGVAVASFALYDPTTSITVTVQGAAGNVIPLDPAKNGLVVVDDPASLVHLGYGFQNPKPGPWVITLQTTDRTPPEGADYAITAHLEGGAVLNAQASSILAAVGQEVTLNAGMQAAGLEIPLRTVTAQIRGPQGSTETVELAPQNGRFSATWKPSQPGLYAIDLLAVGGAAGEAPLERSAFLTVQAQPPVRPLQIYLILALIALGLFVVLVGPLLWWRRRRRK